MNIATPVLCVHPEILTPLISVTGEDLGMEIGWASLHQIERAGQSKGLARCSLETVTRIMKEKMENSWKTDDLTHRLIMDPIGDDSGWPCIFGFNKEGVVSSRGEPHSMIWLTHCQFVFSVKNPQIATSCLNMQGVVLLFDISYIHGRLFSG